MAKVISLPSNIEAERSVLGAMLISPEAASIAIGSLEEKDFSGVDMRNNLIFRAMNELALASKPIDPQTVNDQLVAMKLDSEVEIGYLLELMNTAIFPQNVDNYIDMVHEQSVLRQLLLETSKIQDEYAKGVPNIGDFILQSNDAISRIAQQRRTAGMKSAKEVAKQVNDELAAATAGSIDTLTGVDTGYKKLNSYTHGWQKGDLIILAARPSVGKTALGMNFAYNAAVRGLPVAFFSLEMSAPSIMKRLLACASGVSNEKIQTGFLNASEKTRIKAAIDDISKTKLFIDDTANCKLGDIMSNATKLKNSYPDLGLIVIDYLGRIRLTDRLGASDRREQEVGLISGQLKQLARTLDVPVICLCQLNRGVEDNNSKIPSLSNLRESGSIEADADIVMLLYRADYYTALGQSLNKKGFKKDEDNSPEKDGKKDTGTSIVQCIVAKNRNGKVGTVDLMFERSLSRFDNPSLEYQEAMAAQRAMEGE